MPTMEHLCQVRMSTKVSNPREAETARASSQPRCSTACVTSQDARAPPLYASGSVVLRPALPLQHLELTMFLWHRLLSRHARAPVAHLPVSPEKRARHPNARLRPLARARRPPPSSSISLRFDYLTPPAPPCAIAPPYSSAHRPLHHYWSLSTDCTHCLCLHIRCPLLLPTLPYPRCVYDSKPMHPHPARLESTPLGPLAPLPFARVDPTTMSRSTPPAPTA